MDKSADAFRTISEAADELGVSQHVLRFWETRFAQIKPLKRAGGRRYYRPRDLEVLRLIKRLLYGEGYTIKGVQRALKKQSADATLWASAEAAGNDRDQQWPAESVNEPPQGPEEETAPCPVPPVCPVAFTSHDIARLRTVLAGLAECEAILDSARRR